MFKGFKMSLITPAAVAVVALLLVSLAQSTTAQNAATATRAATQTPQPPTPSTSPQTQSQAQVPATPAGEAVAAKAAEPLYREYRGVTLGMSAADVRAKLGKPQEKSDGMDFYIFSERERARVYYTDGKATAVIATYIGRDGGAPPPASVLGSEIEAKADGSMYQMKPYREAGYWVAYSRTPGDSPLVMITMQKTP